MHNSSTLPPLRSLLNIGTLTRTQPMADATRGVSLDDDGDADGAAQSRAEEGGVGTLQRVLRLRDGMPRKKKLAIEKT